MLPELYLDAIKNREKNVSIFADTSFTDILQIALTKWMDYCPIKKTTKSVGIDSSWNKKSYQGIDLFVVDCVAVTSLNNILSYKWDYGIKNVTGDSLSSTAMNMEMDISHFVLNKEDLDILCIDGSIISNLVHNKSASYADKVSELFKKNHASNVVFISKNSTTRNQFKEYGSKAADIYYFNKLGLKPGFSEPSKNSYISNFLDVVEIYARLTPFVPLIKIEIVNNTSISEKEIQSILNMLYYHSVKGYPYCLKLAHKSCKITNDDIKRIASVYGLKNEFGSRDSLNE